MTSEPSTEDPHETGREYPVDLMAFAAEWAVDARELRKAMNLASLELRGIEGATPGQIKRELREIARRATELADAIGAASDATIFQWLAGLPGINPGKLVCNPGLAREHYRREIRALADEAVKVSKPIVVTKAPRAGGPTGPPTIREQSAVEAFALVWLKAHGTWPTIYNDKPEDGFQRRRAARGGEFVIAAARVLDLELTPQRLRTIFAKCPAPKET
jgi:hypothetical protein